MVGGIRPYWLRFVLGHLWEELSPRSCYLFADELRKCSWPGVPREVRPVTWRLLSVSSTHCVEKCEPHTALLTDEVSVGTSVLLPRLLWSCWR